MTQCDHLNAARRSPREGGFGLLEIIIVVVIVAILMAAIVPTFMRQKRDAPNKTLVAAAQTFEAAVAEYQRSYPPVSATEDPLFARGSSSAAFTETMPPTQGLFSVAGDALVKQWPRNPFTNAPAVLERVRVCATSGTPGQIQVCRPPGAGGMPDLQVARVVAFGTSPSTGAPVLAYDSLTCRGPCKVQ